MLPPFLRLVLVLGPMAVVTAAPVINEIMYRPGTGVPERTGDEYLEIYNPDAQPVDAGGWRFTAGIDFRFPANTMPEETFREMTVFPEGGVLFLERTANGTRVVRYSCGN